HRTQAQTREAEVARDRAAAAEKEALRKLSERSKRVHTLEEEEKQLKESLDKAEGEAAHLTNVKATLRAQVTRLLTERAEGSPAVRVARFESIVREMDEEFLRSHVAHREAEGRATAFRATSVGLQAEIAALKKQVAAKEHVLEMLREDIWGMKDL